jgi:hypothetical protein
VGYLGSISPCRPYDPYALGDDEYVRTMRSAEAVTLFAHRTVRIFMPIALAIVCKAAVI